ncbi:hypothetical protein M409DRAFT_22338 [Zasmidium cellare ATCC 36951]|uniref:AB hydrolase-1 domain-containing protein n=1 Tax=Zasmidium cellare ATCC 36951 TaxID=1080233 RepID=A0A6A6CKG4_ZASCE|nr:uncharacterized protein M409DRAFT_22338 [Zasmidium cellare ATCC 36951]KAF2167531.1 hypothetical protein M409DRAFT_22338 [Zasmidium cellare ATCC 36951]
MAKPTIVAVPGTWHVPAHFSHVTKELETAGYTVIGVDLPGNSTEYIDNRLANMQDDVDAVRAAILEQLETNNVLLVTHSYSSIVGSAALTDLSPPARSAASLATSVVSLIIISGFICPVGISMVEMMGGKLAPQYLISDDGESTLPFAGPGAVHILYNDLDHNEAAKAIHLLRPQSYACTTSPIPDQVAAMKGIPLSYLLCSEDNALPWERQIGTIQGFREKGIEILYTQVSRSGHSPFLRFPRETARFVRLVAGEEVETGFEDLRADRARPV